jgi:hypothetical protein
VTPLWVSVPNVSTTPARVEAVPAPYAGLLDDAAVLPPAAGLPLAEALRAHRRHRDAWYADLVGPFLVDDRRLTSLLDLLDPDDPPLPVIVVVTGGAGAIEPAARWAVSSPALDLWALEAGLRDLDDLPGSARRVAASAAHLARDLGLDVPVHVDVPLPAAGSAGWLAALDELTAADLRLALDLAGLQPPGAVAAALDAALDRELPFRCTMAPGSPVSSSGRVGVLNVLLATRVALDGGDVAGALTEEDPTAVREALGSVDPEGLVRARRWCTSAGCPDVDRALAGLLALRLLTGPGD